MHNIRPGASGASILSQLEIDVNVKFARKFGRSSQPKKRGVTRLTQRSPQPNKRLSGSTAQIAQYERRKAQPPERQLTIWESQRNPETEYPLRIESLPPALQWWEEEHFWLIHVQSGLRVPGTWSLAEAELIRDLSQNWDWAVDKDRRVACGLQLLALAEAVCKRSSQKGGEA